MTDNTKPNHTNKTASRDDLVSFIDNLETKTIMIPGLNKEMVFKQLSGLEWEMVQDGYLSMMDTATAEGADLTDGKRALEFFRSGGDNKMDFLANMIVACSHEPALSIDDVDLVRAWPFPTILDVGVELLAFVGDPESEEVLEKNQTRFRGESGA